MEPVYQNNFRTQHELKRFFRFCLLRQYLLNVSGSGVYRYSISGLKDLCYSTGINYTTLRKTDLIYFERTGLLFKRGSFITLVSLERKNRILYDAFIKFETEIRQSKKPAFYFADLIKEKFIWKNVLTQVRMEAKKLDEKTGRKLIQSVRRKNVRIGDRNRPSGCLDQDLNFKPVKHDKYGVFLSLRVIGRIFKRSKTTAYKYIQSISDNELLKVEKDKTLTKKLTKHGLPYYRRNQNKYVFNW